MSTGNGYVRCLVESAYDMLVPSDEKQAINGPIMTQQNKNSNSTTEMQMPKKQHQFTVTTVSNQFTTEAYELYQRYQMTVHKDTAEECSASQYKRFLCMSPLINTDKYGSFHQHYRIDGKLVAVGVVDILPRCLSSVYAFYDPDLSKKLNLGVVTALHEIDWVRQCIEQNPLTRCYYYYMGFYVHSCSKMRYKAEYKPSDLLCDEALTWHPLAQCVPHLDRNVYVAFSKVCDPSPDDDDDPKVRLNKLSGNLSDLQLDINGTVFPINMLRLSRIPQVLIDFVQLMSPSLLSEVIVDT